MRRICDRSACSISVTALACFWQAVSSQTANTAKAQAYTEPPSVVVRWLVDLERPSQAHVEVAGLSETTLQRLAKTNWTISQWQQLLPVYAEQDELGKEIEVLPMAGDYRISTNVLQFKPAFPLDSEVSYRAIFHSGALPGAVHGFEPSISVTHRFPAQAFPQATVVTQVYPTAAVLPENLLKFYLHFSAPMSRGHIYQYIHLRKANGSDVELPFLEIDEELWDPTMTRLTLFLDPGRIKRGVRPLEEIGACLETGQHYELVVSREWRDATGHALGTDFKKAFEVSPPNREPLDPSRWKIVPPKAGSRGELQVNFLKPLDHALAERLIHITDALGNSIFGDVKLTDTERLWTFVPSEVWQPGRHQLLISTSIEDLAGNNIGKPFDVDLFESIEREVTNQVAKLTFVVE